jgi:hypothetical protein
METGSRPSCRFKLPTIPTLNTEELPRSQPATGHQLSHLNVELASRRYEESKPQHHARQLGSYSAKLTDRCYIDASACINLGMRYARDLTDEHWKILDPLIPKQRDEQMGEADLGKAAGPS